MSHSVRSVSDSCLVASSSKCGSSDALEKPYLGGALHGWTSLQFECILLGLCTLSLLGASKPCCFLNNARKSASVCRLRLTDAHHVAAGDPTGNAFSKICSFCCSVATCPADEETYPCTRSTKSCTARGAKRPLRSGSPLNIGILRPKLNGFSCTV